MKNYERANIEIVKIADDVITTSLCENQMPSQGL